MLMIVYSSPLFWIGVRYNRIQPKPGKHWIIKKMYLVKHLDSMTYIITLYEVSSLIITRNWWLLLTKITKKKENAIKSQWSAFWKYNLPK